VLSGSHYAFNAYQSYLHRMPLDSLRFSCPVFLLHVVHFLHFSILRSEEDDEYGGTTEGGIEWSSTER